MGTDLRSVGDWEWEPACKIPGIMTTAPGKVKWNYEFVRVLINRVKLIREGFYSGVYSRQLNNVPYDTVPFVGS